LELSATALRRRVRAANVVARLPGSGPLAREAVVLGAHYDHLGIGPAVAGDSIYNGALDNAAGTAAMLAIAEAAARVPGRAGRAIYFVAFTAEEKGLLGSEAFVRRPPVPLPRITAMLNIDGIGAFAMPRDVAALGAEYSWLGATFAAAAAAEGFRVTPPGSTPLEVARQQDIFGRSDQLPFARAGVPALDLYFVADEYVGRPRGWGVQQLDLYLRERYHQPNDDLSQPFDARYVIPQLRAYARTLVGTATSVDGPQWYPGAPYRRPDS
jgi:Zn-dependent M28 family amino/carboxypeptidase